MTRQIPWLRVFVEGVVIVGSILLAFGIEAWWDGVQEREEEQILLADFVEEFEANRTSLDFTTNRHREKAATLRTLIREAGPSAEGIASDSLNSLASAALLTQLFDSHRGVMERALSGNGLAVIEDSDLRTQLAGFWNRSTNYFANQEFLLSSFSSAVVFETGTLVFQMFPRLESMGSTTMWSDPLTPDQARALKQFSLMLTISDALITQGEFMLTDIDSVLIELGHAQDR